MSRSPEFNAISIRYPSSSPFITSLQMKISITIIVRGSDYSPASELFARVRQTMTGNNPKLDLINVDAHKKIGQILTICSQGFEQKQNSDINQGPKLCQKFAKKTTGNNLKLDLVNIDAYKIWSDSVSSFSRY